MSGERPSEHEMHRAEPRAALGQENQVPGGLGGKKGGTGRGQEGEGACGAAGRDAGALRERDVNGEGRWKLIINKVASLRSQATVSTPPRMASPSNDDTPTPDAVKEQRLVGSLLAEEEEQRVHGATLVRDPARRAVVLKLLAEKVTSLHSHIQGVPRKVPALRVELLGSSTNLDSDDLHKVRAHAHPGLRRIRPRPTRAPTRPSCHRFTRRHRGRLLRANCPA